MEHKWVTKRPEGKTEVTRTTFDQDNDQNDNMMEEFIERTLRWNSLLTQSKDVKLAIRERVNVAQQLESELNWWKSRENFDIKKLRETHFDLYKLWMTFYQYVFFHANLDDMRSLHMLRDFLHHARQNLQLSQLNNVGLEIKNLCSVGMQLMEIDQKIVDKQLQNQDEEHPISVEELFNDYTSLFDQANNVLTIYDQYNSTDEKQINLEDVTIAIQLITCRLKLLERL